MLVIFAYRIFDATYITAALKWLIRHDRYDMTNLAVSTGQTSVG